MGLVNAFVFLARPGVSSPQLPFETFFDGSLISPLIEQLTNQELSLAQEFLRIDELERIYASVDDYLRHKRGNTISLQSGHKIDRQHVVDFLDRLKIFLATETEAEQVIMGWQ